MKSKSHKHTKETKKKISLALKGRGHKQTEETKKKISLARKGVCISEGTRRRMALAKTGHKHTEETRQKMSLAKRGKCRPEETRRKLGLALEGKTWEERFGIEKATELKKKYSEYGKEHTQEFLRRIFSNSDKKPTNPEKILINHSSQNSLPYKYVGDGKFWINLEGININPDFINVNHKKEFIEVLGCYWHGCKRCFPDLFSDIEESKAHKAVLHNVRRDQLKRDLLQKYGYNIIYIWEHEIRDGSFVNKM